MSQHKTCGACAFVSFRAFSYHSTLTAFFAPIFFVQAETISCGFARKWPGPLVRSGISNIIIIRNV